MRRYEAGGNNTHTHTHLEPEPKYFKSILFVFLCPKSGIDFKMKVEKNRNKSMFQSKHKDTTWRNLSLFLNLFLKTF